MSPVWKRPSPSQPLAWAAPLSSPGSVPRSPTALGGGSGAGTSKPRGQREAARRPASPAQRKRLSTSLRAPGIPWGGRGLWQASAGARRNSSAPAARPHGALPWGLRPPPLTARPLPASSPACAPSAAQGRGTGPRRALTSVNGSISAARSPAAPSGRPRAATPPPQPLPGFEFQRPPLPRMR